MEKFKDHLLHHYTKMRQLSKGQILKGKFDHPKTTCNGKIQRTSFTFVIFFLSKSDIFIALCNQNLRASALKVYKGQRIEMKMHLSPLIRGIYILTISCGIF